MSTPDSFPSDTQCSHRFKVSDIGFNVLSVPFEQVSATESELVSSVLRPRSLVWLVLYRPRHISTSMLAKPTSRSSSILNCTLYGLSLSKQKWWGGGRKAERDKRYSTKRNERGLLKEVYSPAAWKTERYREGGGKK